jgi:pseudouridine synthase, RluA family
VSVNASVHTGRQSVSFLEIGEEAAGQRIDNFLLSHLKGVPRSHIYRTLRKGEVRVNRGRIGPDYRLQKGDVVRLPPVRRRWTTVPREPHTNTLQRLQSALLYEDDGLLILNKPAGIAVHGGSGVSYGVIEALRALRPNASGLALVHRLDQQTSGCLMVAKKRSLLRALHDLLRRGALEKRYLALVSGRLRGCESRVCAPLRKNVVRGGERVVSVSENGKQAVSRFRLIANYGFASLVEVILVTGRTHQIRVHARHIGHPVAGDEKYGDPTFNRRIGKVGLGRLFLHAQALSFIHPATGRELYVSAPLDEALERVLSRLELNLTLSTCNTVC